MNPARSTKKLGELLVQRGLVTQQQLNEALEHQRHTKEFLGAILVRIKALTAQQLLVTLSEQLGVPHGSLRPEDVNWAIVRQFPKSVLATGTWFPVRADAESVTVAIANPLDAWAMSAIEKAVGFRKVRPLLVPEHELKAVLRTYQAETLKALDAHFSDDG